MNVNPIQFRLFPTSVSLDKYSCIELSNEDESIVAVVDCDDQWTPDKISYMCNVQDIKSVLVDLPVYDDDDGVVYRNRYCAICNGVPFDRISSFPYSVTEPPAHLLIMIPRTETGKPRRCFKFPDNECKGKLAHNCNSSYWPIPSGRLLSGFSRNLFCAACTGVVYTHSEPVDYCTLDLCPNDGPEKTCLFANNIRNVANLFSTSEKDTDDRSKCIHPWQIYDAIADGCRFSGCPYGYFYLQGSCIEGTVPYDAPQFVLTKQSNECRQCVVSLMPHILRETLLITVCSLVSENVDSGPFAVRITFRNLFDMVKVLNDLHKVVMTDNAKTMIYHRCGAAVVILSLESDMMPKAQCSSGIDFEGTSSTTLDMCQSASDVKVIQYEYEAGLGYYTSTVTNVSDRCWRELVTTNLACSSFQSGSPRPENATHSATDSTIIIPDYLLTSLQKPNLDSQNATWICTHNGNRILIKILESVTDTCHLVALVVIFLVFLTYGKFPNLRNVTEGCHMNLLVAFSAVYGAYLLNKRFQQNEVVCQCIAIYLHFGYNACLLWICIPFYKMYVKYKRQLNRSPFNFRENGKLFRYMFFAWGIPLTLTVICAYISHCNCTPGVAFRYRYNGIKCFIEGDLANVLLVIIPSGLALLCASFSFIYFFRGFLRVKSSLSTFQRATGADKHLQGEIEDNMLVSLYIKECNFFFLGGGIISRNILF